MLRFSIDKQQLLNAVNNLKFGRYCTSIIFDFRNAGLVRTIAGLQNERNLLWEQIEIGISINSLDGFTQPQLVQFSWDDMMFFITFNTSDATFDFSDARITIGEIDYQTLYCQINFESDEIGLLQDNLASSILFGIPCPPVWNQDMILFMESSKKVFQKNMPKYDIQNPFDPIGPVSFKIIKDKPFFKLLKEVKIFGKK